MATLKKKSLAPKQWTMLAYIAGDNNLSDNGIEDIAEMAAKGTNAKTYAGVQIDTEGEHDGSVRYEISVPDATGHAHRTVIDRLPESDSGNPQVLLNFLNWGLGRYPAKNTIAVVWNHGAGFRTVRRDIAFDDYGTSLDMNELQRALMRAGLGPNRKLAILGFDACLMNMLEITHHLRKVTRYVVGSQETEPGDGWPYDLVLAAMNRNPTPATMARKIVREYMRSYRTVGDSNITQSAIRTDRTEAAVQAWSRLGNALVAALPSERGKINVARTKVQSYEYPDYVDAIHLADLLAKGTANATVRSRAKAFSAAVAKCIVDNDSEGASVSHSNGLTIWYPPEKAQYLAFRGKYTAMDFHATGPGWVNFLDTLHA
jgi:hypothetical protein